jgi:hypothetical protein
MDVAKLRLSEEELRLVSDPGFILTKNAIIGKVYLLFGSLAEEMRHDLKFPEEVAAISPKISRGENYLGLPYVMLDYPRYFSKEDTMAIRTFFWWGNFFSITLHLKGMYRNRFAERIITAQEQLSMKKYALAVSDEEWQHHFGKENYRPVHEFRTDEFRKYVSQHPYLKLSIAFPLLQWNEMHEQIREAYIDLGKLIS